MVTPKKRREPKKPRREDFNQTAFRIVQHATREKGKTTKPKN